MPPNPLRRPQWIRFVLLALFYATGLFVLIPSGPRGVLTAVVSLAMGFVLAAAMVLAVRREDRRTFGGPVTGEDQAAVTRAVTAGTPPADERLRAPADRLAHTWASPRMRPVVEAGVLSLFTALNVYLAVARTPWFWCLAGLTLIITVAQWRTARAKQRAGRRYLSTAP